MHTNKLFYLLSRDRRGVFATNSNKCTLKINKTKENKKKKKKKKALNVCYTYDYTDFRVRYERTSVHIIIELLNLN